MIQKHSTTSVETTDASENVAASPPPDVTRVFVSGLPPKFTSEQLAAHFGSDFTVTDAHVLADRRIGFVGFKDSISALKATAHFNKSYIRLSKIAVDLAKPVELSRTSDTSVPVSKRAQHFSEQNPNKKRKRSQDDNDKPSTVLKPNQQLATEIEHSIDEENKDEANSQLPTTDHDWLRGRTTRTLDLVDPDDIQLQPEQYSGNVPFKDLTNTSSSAPALKDADADAESETDVEAHNLRKVPNARLFLRNLAFSVTQDDLDNRFKQFGKIQEVSFIHFLLLHSIAT